MLRLALCNLVYTYCKYTQRGYFDVPYLVIITDVLNVFFHLLNSSGRPVVLFFKEGIYILYETFVLKFIF